MISKSTKSVQGLNYLTPKLKKRQNKKLRKSRKLRLVIEVIPSVIRRYFKELSNLVVRWGPLSKKNNQSQRDRIRVSYLIKYSKCRNIIDKLNIPRWGNSPKILIDLRIYQFSTEYNKLASSWSESRDQSLEIWT